MRALAAIVVGLAALASTHAAAVGSVTVTARYAGIVHYGGLEGGHALECPDAVYPPEEGRLTLHVAPADGTAAGYSAAWTFVRDRDGCSITRACAVTGAAVRALTLLWGLCPDLTPGGWMDLKPLPDGTYEFRADFTPMGGTSWAVHGILVRTG